MKWARKIYKCAADKWCLQGLYIHFCITDSTNYCLFVSLTTKLRKIIFLHKTSKDWLWKFKDNELHWSEIHLTTNQKEKRLKQNKIKEISNILSLHLIKIIRCHKISNFTAFKIISWHKIFLSWNLYSNNLKLYKIILKKT